MEEKEMNSQMQKVIMSILALMFIAGHVPGQNTGREIMLKVDQQPDGDTRKSFMTMELVNKRGSKRVRSMNSYSKDYGEDKKSIMFFQEPADVKGTGFLTWDYQDEDKNDDRWLYLPAMKKTRRINGSSAKKEYFMGSDFTYDDMGNRNVDEDKHELKRTEIINDIECWVIESTPKDKSELYSKRVLWVRQDNYMVTRIEYYDKQGEMMKELEVNEMKKINGYWVNTMMTMNHRQRDHKTIIYIKSIEFDIPADDNLFTVNALEKGYIN